MSLIADSLKKAVKEKSFNVSPGINLLKNLGSKAKSSTKFDPKEVKKFIILIVVPDTILAYLLLANPLDPNKKSRQVSPLVVAKTPAPPDKPAPQPVPRQSSPPPSQNSVPAKEPDNIPIIEPGMKEVPVLENEEEVVKPKPVPGPKKKSSTGKTKAQEPDQVRVAKAKPFTPERPSAKINQPAKKNPLQRSLEKRKRLKQNHEKNQIGGSRSSSRNLCQGSRHTQNQ